MRLRFTPSVLLLLAATPAWSDSPPASGLRLQEGPPPGFQVDGKLDEWKQPPSLTLGAAQQVDGPAKVASPEDLSAQLWVALGPQGLAVAGEVKDDRVQLPLKPEQLNKDHVEVSLALPAPQLPPIAFINQTGEHVLDSAAACEDNPALVVGEPADCRKWWKQQGDYRKKLLRPFSAQYALMEGVGVRVGIKGKEARVGRVHYEPFEGGYRFEALIPPSALPRSAQAPLRELKLRVELIDSDEANPKGKGKRESVLSSGKGKPSADPGTFPALTLATPVRLGTWPDLLERAMKANGPGASCTVDGAGLAVWLNPARGNQYTPEDPSPQVVEVNLSRVEKQGALGDVEVVTVPAQVDRFGAVGTWLVSRRGTALLDAQAGSGTSGVRTTPRPPGLNILWAQEEPLSPLGIGVCASCPQLSFQLVKMDAQGKFSEPERLEGVASQGEKVTWEAPADLSRLEAFSEKPGASKQLAVRYTWNPKTGHYER